MAVAELMLSFALLITTAPTDDESARQQAIANARQMAVDGRWAEAARTLTPHVDPATANADVLVLLARAVFESGDLRRARLLAETGLLRFADDLRFRRLDLAVLVARRQWGEASAAARSLLATHPDDPVAWRQLAAATLAGGDESEQRVVLEAAHLAVPDDPLLLQKHIRAQFLANHVDTAKKLIEGAAAKSSLASDRRFITLAVRIAERADDPALARRWLDRVPPAERDTQLTLLEARLAIASNNKAAAEKALSRLIERGDANPSVLVRAGQLAEARGALGRAEVLYTQAGEGTGDQARIARLFLARFLAKIGNRERAEDILRAYLAERPDDAYARQLLRVVRVEP